ncbi:hypothetical protein C1N53_18665 [Pontibacter sp. SGAir0037]|nr:hypothetical protein C1N53_18665 [Pontibacter sp. SGAir0037]
MVPDGLVLAMHTHTHTPHEEGMVVKQHPGLEKVDTAHIHCPVEDLFGAPYHASLNHIRFSQPAPYSMYVAARASAWGGLPGSSSHLRGPPTA